MDTAYVYFIQDCDESAVKISSTTHTLFAQMNNLPATNSHNFRFIGAIDVRVGFGEDKPSLIELGQIAMRLERKIQRQFAENRLRGEWFKLTDELREFIQTRSNVTEV